MNIEDHNISRINTYILNNKVAENAWILTFNTKVQQIH